MKAFKCDWCGIYKCGYSNELKIYAIESIEQFDLCDKCKKELLKKLKEIK